MPQRQKAHRHTGIPQGNPTSTQDVHVTQVGGGGGEGRGWGGCLNFYIHGTPPQTGLISMRYTQNSLTNTNRTRHIVPAIHACNTTPNLESRSNLRQLSSSVLFPSRQLSTPLHLRAVSMQKWFWQVNWVGLHVGYSEDVNTINSHKSPPAQCCILLLLL